jgi:hypothetical protein
VTERMVCIVIIKFWYYIICSHLPV